MEPETSDAGQVLALCEASADERASAAIRRIIDDAELPPDAKAAFFKGLRAALEDPAARDHTPWNVIQDFMDGPGRQYMFEGEETGEVIPDDDAPTYVRGLLQLALREQVSRILIVPSGVALYRGSELHLVVPPPEDLLAELFQYCCAVAGLAEDARETACAVAKDGTLAPASSPGIPCRLQRVSNGRVSGLQIALG